MDRRTTIKWVLAASASWPLLRALPSWAAEAAPVEPMLALKGYGTDPDLLKTYHPGEAWPLTLSTAQPPLLQPPIQRARVAVAMTRSPPTPI